MGVLISVQAGLFENKQVKPHFLNTYCFGEDFAAWLKREISPLRDSSFKFSDPVQEDYGWSFWARQGKDSFWVAILYMGESPQEPPALWVVSVTPDRGLNGLRRELGTLDRQALDKPRNRVCKAVTSN